MVQAKRDAVVQEAREGVDVCGAEIPPDDVSTEGQRKPARSVRPPLAEIDDLLQSFFCVRQLTLVNQQTGLDGSAVHFFLDLVERHDDELDIRVEQPQRQKGRRQLAWNRDADAFERRRAILTSDDDGTVAV